ncbi:MAG: type II toxin-antitoxin system RelE/ParE family toxin [Candidatus Levybacteria bacterium]|nr:type II toxin-antitoxin system RelE/ParE family toxin [Candidatus Levybacteria bacterium]
MRLALSDNAQREYKRIPRREQAKIKKKMAFLENNPYAGKKLSGEFAKYHSIQAWPYRIIYRVDKEENRIYVQKIQHRQGAYK